MNALDLAIDWIFRNPRKFLGLALLTCASFLFLAGYLPYSRIVEAHRSLQDRHDWISQGHRQLEASLLEGEMSSEKLQQARERLESWFPPRLSRTRVAELLSSFSQRFGVILTDPPSGESRDVAGFTVHTIRLAARGRLEMLYRMLEELPRSSPLIEVSHTVLRPTQSGQGEARWTLIFLEHPDSLSGASGLGQESEISQ